MKCKVAVETHDDSGYYPYYCYTHNYRGMAWQFDGKHMCDMARIEEEILKELAHHHPFFKFGRDNLA